jgi:hypothetical protein
MVGSFKLPISNRVEPPVIINDADALAYITAVEIADGFPLENLVKIEIENFILELKANSLWASISNLGLISVARTLAGGLVPIKGVVPENINFVSTDYNRLSGLKGNGSNKRLRLNSLSSIGASNNHHLSVYITEHATVSGWLMNDATASTGTVSLGISGALNYTSSNQSSAIVTLVPILNSPTFFGVARNNSSNFRYLVNAVSETSVTQASQTLNTVPMNVYGTNAGTIVTNARMMIYSMGFNLNLVTFRSIVDTFIANVQNAILASLNQPPPNEYDVIFIGGQSNSDGYVQFSDVNTPNYIKNGILRKYQNIAINVWNGTKIVNYNFALRGPDNNGNQYVDALSPVRRWSQNHVAINQIANFSYRKILIVQITEGGTQVSKLPRQTNNKGSWNVDFANIFSGGIPLLLRMKERYDDLQSFASANGISLFPKAVLWHQGEADYDVSINPNITVAERQSALDNFEADMIDVIDYFRNDIANNPDLLFLYGTVKSTSTKFSSAIQTAHLNIAASDGKAFVLNTNDLAFFDGLHFNGWSNVVFGNWLAQRYFENI